jgi:hypothetical protein
MQLLGKTKRAVLALLVIGSLLRLRTFHCLRYKGPMNPR